MSTQNLLFQDGHTAQLHSNTPSDNLGLMCLLFLMPLLLPLEANWYRRVSDNERMPRNSNKERVQWPVQSKQYAHSKEMKQRERLCWIPNNSNNNNNRAEACCWLFYKDPHNKKAQRFIRMLEPQRLMPDKSCKHWKCVPVIYYCTFIYLGDSQDTGVKIRM